MDRKEEMKKKLGFKNDWEVLVKLATTSPIPIGLMAKEKGNDKNRRNIQVYVGKRLY